MTWLSGKKRSAEQEQEPRDEGMRPEKKDARAMVIAAFITIFPFVILMVLILFGLLWLMFG